MLGRLELDDETFDEIFEYYKKKIPQIYRQWTDFNMHDPGITFLELLSWMKEMQQFYLDQIGPEHYRTFLKLIGMKQRRKEPVQTFAVLSQIERDFYLPKNSRIYAGDILFETVEERHFSLNRLLLVSSDIEKKRGKGAKVILQFEHPFPKEKYHRVYFQIAEPVKGKRQPVREGFLPFIQWKLEVIKEGKRIPCKILRDETYGLLYSGEIHFLFQEEQGKEIQPKPEQETGMTLCFTIENGKYDMVPSIRSVEWNTVPVRQTVTRSICEKTVSTDGQRIHLNSRLACHGKIELYKEEEGIWYLVEAAEKEMGPDGIMIRLKNKIVKNAVLYAVMYETGFEAERSFEMDGFPFQKIKLEDTELLQNGIGVIVEHPLKKGCFEPYQRVEDFHNSGPKDRHYVFDEEQGCLYFGDCERGMAPKGILKIICYISSKGLKGNIKEHQLKLFEDGTTPARVTNYENTSSGADKESIEECFQRFIRERAQTERAVTMEDYENLVRRTPGLRIHKVKATTSFHAANGEYQAADNTVYIVVKPYSDEPMPKLDSGYEKNIRNMLEPRRMLGTKIQILSPEYVGIYLLTEVVCKSHYKDAKERIEQTITKYFEEELMDFGITLVYGKLYGLIESLDCVVAIKSLSLHAQGKGVLRSPNGDYQMPPNALLYLKSADFIVTVSE